MRRQGCSPVAFGTLKLERHVVSSDVRVSIGVDVLSSGRVASWPVLRHPFGEPGSSFSILLDMQYQGTREVDSARGSQGSRLRTLERGDRFSILAEDLQSMKSIWIGYGAYKHLQEVQREQW